ncbi:MAG: histone deacetylase [Candidatus Eremiobacteraeota bacterium]|nr:histone deacetylase [Candidatus Eremiobacteraeota bacterium]MBV8222759.1 histone deacetylase [Candidatus Eremiobacteraeota bacterium]
MLDVIYDSRFTEHLTGEGHPERAARLGALIEGLTEGGAPPSGYQLPTIVDSAALARVHDPAYIGLVERICEGLPEYFVAELPTGDAIVGHDSFQIALLAAGAAVDAARRARADRPMFALVRPPGHHAEPARGMGFCVLNNVAVAANAARLNAGATLIVDFDYHHGNGTQAWVQRALDDGAPLGFISTHAYPAYPGTGAFSESRVSDNGFIIDVPLDLTTNTHDFIGVWSMLLPPLAAKLKPKTIVVSTGFDFLEGDPIAGLPVHVEAVDALCGLLGEAAAEHDAGLAFVLEGGYSLPNLRASGRALARSFGADENRVHVPTAHVPHDPRLKRIIETVLHGE